MRSSRSFWRKARVLLLIGLVLFIAIQFIRPPLDNPPVTADLQAPPEVKAILRKACYDCHSNETKVAWFDWPVPAWWQVVSDVKEGRRVLNFSRFDSLPKGQQATKLFECIMQVEQHGMPLSAYTALHRDGRLSTGDIAVLKQYAVSIGYHPKPDTGRERAAAEQYTQWTSARGDTGSAATTTAARGPQDEHNGIGYAPLAGFANWTPVSTTERYDNGTLRLILGNDVVVRAIREGHSGAWPDGSVFAKVAWDQLPDSSGELHAGAYRQVEFMIRDSKKYSATFGWGWARWVGGLALTPYGKDASFVEECMNCHRPLKSTDHTFTFPIADTLRLYDQAAQLPDSVGGYPLKGKFITSFVNGREGTMSTLYGNEEAVTAARQGHWYAAGAVLTLVTWSQREDPHWFGGRIPKGMVIVEQVQFHSEDEMRYKRYEGMPLAERLLELPAMLRRMKYIIQKKASVLP